MKKNQEKWDLEDKINLALLVAVVILNIWAFDMWWNGKTLWD